MDDYENTYAGMSDGEIVSLAAESDSLREEARNALWGELGRRGLGQQATNAYEKHSSGKLVTVATFTPIKAQLAKTKLESEEIQCFVADQHSRIIRFLFPFIAGVELQVKNPDVKRAREILGEETYETPCEE